MEGFNVRRHDDNPKEKEFHDKFLEEFIDAKYKSNAVDKLVYGTDNYGNARDFLSDHEKRIVLSAIQWLGSPVGQSFLLSCGFKEADNRSFRSQVTQQQIQSHWDSYNASVPDMESTDDPFIFKYKTTNSGYKLIDLRKHERTHNDHARRHAIVFDIVSQLEREIVMGSILPEDLNRWYQINRNPSSMGGGVSGGI